MRRHRRFLKVVLPLAFVALLFAVQGCMQPQHPPTVTLSVPETIKEGMSLAVKFTANDPDGDELTYKLMFDGEVIKEGVVSADKLGETIDATTIGPDLLTLGEHTINIIVSDKGGLTGNDSKVVEVVENLKPVINILSAPEKVSAGSEFTTSFTLTDEDDSEISYSVTVNDSEIASGTVVSGEKVDVKVSAPDISGILNVVITASDGYNTVSKELTVEVIKNSPPVVTINYIPEKVYTTSNLDLIFYAVDKEDDYPLSYKVYFDDSTDPVATGSIEEGEQTKSLELNITGLSVGYHTITVRVEDSKGMFSEAKANFEIVELVENHPPTVSIETIDKLVNKYDDYKLRFSVLARDQDPEDSTLNANIYVYKLSDSKPETPATTIGLPNGVIKTIEIDLSALDENSDYFLLVEVSDGRGGVGEAIEVFSFYKNHPPVIENADFDLLDTLKTWIDYSIKPLIYDEDGDPLSIAVKLIDAASGNIYTLYSESNIAPGEIEINFRIENDVTPNASYTLALEVSDPEDTVRATKEVYVVPDDNPWIDEVTILVDGKVFNPDTDTIVISKDSTKTITIEFVPNDDTKGQIFYLVKFLGKEKAGYANKGEKVTVEIEFSGNEVGTSGYRTLTIDLENSLNHKKGGESYSINIGVVGSVVLENLTGQTLISPDATKITFNLSYEKGDMDYPSTIVFAVYRIDPKTSEAALADSTEVSYDENFPINYATFTVGIGNDASINLADQLAGKFYAIAWIKDVYGNKVDGAESDKLYFYFYEKAASATWVIPATNCEYENAYKGENSLTFNVELKAENSGIATTVLLPKDTFFQKEFNFTERDPEITMKGTWIEVDDYYYVELPATISFTLDPLLDRKDEVSAPVVTATITMADPEASTVGISTTLKNIDSLEPRFEISNILGINNYQIRVDYNLADINFKIATVNFYIKDGEDYKKVGDVEFSTTTTFDSTIATILEEFDKSEIYYSYEAEDELGHATSMGVPTPLDAGFTLDTGFGTVVLIDVVNARNVSIKDDISYNGSDATEITFTFKLCDLSGAPNAGGVSIEFPNNIETVSSSDLVSASQEGTCLTYEYKFTVTQSTETKFPVKAATIIAADLYGNPATVTFPEATIVIDTEVPTFTFDVSATGGITIDATEGYLDQVIVEASFNGASAVMLSTGTTVGLKLDKDTFLEKLGKVPNNEDVEIKITLIDKAGNKDSSETTQKIDLVPPELNPVSDVVITRDSTQPKLYIRVKYPTSDEIAFIKVSGGDMPSFKLIYDYGTSFDTFVGQTNMDVTNATEATLTLTFDDNVTLKYGTTITVSIYASDNVYEPMEVALFTVDYSDLFPKKEYVQKVAAVTTGSATVMIYRTNASTMTIDIPGKAEYDSSTYVIKMEGNTIPAGSVTASIGGTTWKTINLEDWTYDLSDAEPIDTYVPEVFPYNVDNALALVDIGGTLYWDLSAATQIKVTLPAKEGLWWQNVTPISSINADENLLDATVNAVTITFDYDKGQIFDSTIYKREKFDNAATVEAYIGDTNWASITRVMLNIYTKGLMDKYEPSIIDTMQATILDDGTLVATVTFEFLNLDVAVNSVLSDVATISDINVATSTNNINVSNWEATIDDSDTSYATVVIIATNTAIGSSNDSGAATLTIPQDAIKFLFKPDGFTNGFWITNFSGVLVTTDSDVNN